MKVLYKLIVSRFKKIILPEWYVSNVSNECRKYQFWEMVQEFCNCSILIIAIEAALRVYGVGNSTVTVLATSALFFYQSSFSKIAEIVFNLMIDKNTLDWHTKEWKLLSDFVTIFSFSLDLLTNIFLGVGSSSIILCCVSNGLRAISGGIGWTTRATILQHLTQGASITTSQLESVHQIQRTLIHFISFGLLIPLLPRITTSLALVCLTYILLGLASIISSVQGLKYLQFKTLNSNRLNFVIKNFLQTGIVPSVEQANLEEKLLFSFGSRPEKIYGVWLQLGESLEQALKMFSTSIIQSSNNSYFILPILNSNNPKIFVFLHEDTHDTIQVLEAYFRAVCTAYYVHVKRIDSFDCENSSVASSWISFLDQLKMTDFDISRLLIHVGPWRMNWTYEWDHKEECLVLKETQFPNGLTKVYHILEDSQRWIISRIIKTEQKSDKHEFRHYVSIFKEMFLPDGYPESVSPDYCLYQFWDSVQDFSGVLLISLQILANLRVYGVGDLSITPYQTTIIIFLQDSFSKLATIAFASTQGKTLDEFNKQWRFLADALFNVAILLDCITPYFSGHFGPLLFIVAGGIRAIVASISGATRFTLIGHQARNFNFGNVASKDKSQLVFAQLLGGLIVYNLLSYIDENQIIFWITCIIFAFVHVFSSHCAMRALEFRTLNTQRLFICLEHFIHYHKVPSVGEVNRLENILFGFGLTCESVCGLKVKICTNSVETKSNNRKECKSDQSTMHRFEIRFDQNQDVIHIQVKAWALDPITIIEAYARAILAASATTTVCSFYAKQNQQKQAFRTFVDPFNPKLTKTWKKFRKAMDAKGFQLNNSSFIVNR